MSRDDYGFLQEFYQTEAEAEAVGQCLTCLNARRLLDQSPCPDCAHHVARWDAEEKAKLAKEEAQTSPVKPYDPNDVPF